MSSCLDANRRISVLFTLHPHTLRVIDRFKTHSRGKFLDVVVQNWAQKCDNSDSFVSKDVIELQAKVEKMAQIILEKDQMIRKLEVIYGVSYADFGKIPELVPKKGGDNSAKNGAGGPGL